MVRSPFLRFLLVFVTWRFLKKLGNPCHQVRDAFYSYTLTSQFNYSYNAIRKIYGRSKTLFSFNGFCSMVTRTLLLKGML
ncbi:MAG: hypothetical protein A2157_20255 [Deltaproteobacteria bacterium RBG_16_47_11]|nr:MAG: hypothetical protein A2157_20255 [Deltaproteobacteria bacterium RBG_16_47_11]